MEIPMTTATRFQVTTAPTASLVDLAEVKSHLYVYNTDDDAYLTELIIAAEDAVSGFIGEYVVPTGITAYFNRFDDIVLPHNYVSPTGLTVSYQNSSGTVTTVANTVYVLDTTGTNTRVRVRAGQSAPTNLSDDFESPVTVTYTTAFPTTHLNLMIQAITMTIGELYRNRENSSATTMSSVPLSAERLLSRFRSNVL